MDCIWIFLVVWNWERFLLSGSRCMSDAITSTKLEQTGKCFGTADAVCVHGYLCFEPGVWKWNEGLPCLCADCKKLISSILFKFSHSILDLMVLSWNFGGISKTFFEGSVDHIIYRDYIVNRRFFIYCSLATHNSSRLPSVNFRSREFW